MSASSEASRTRWLLPLLIVINLMIWGIVVTGCAVRGLHLDELRINPKPVLADSPTTNQVDKPD